MLSLALWSVSQISPIQIVSGYLPSSSALSVCFCRSFLPNRTNKHVDLCISYRKFLKSGAKVLLFFDPCKSFRHFVRTYRARSCAHANCNRAHYRAHKNAHTYMCARIAFSAKKFSLFAYKAVPSLYFNLPNVSFRQLNFRLGCKLRRSCHLFINPALNLPK